MKKISLALLVVLSACSEKTETSFEDFEASYFSGLQVDERTEACSQWYEDCVAAGYSEEACSTRVEYCEEDWVSDEDREEEREESSSDCDDISTRAYEECLQAGASEEDCRERAARAYEECARTQ